MRDRKGSVAVFGGAQRGRYFLDAGFQSEAVPRTTTILDVIPI